jgi:hypothetical protein
MAASGFTPIQLYRSATPGAVPTAANLAPGELALNTADQKLFFENASGVVVSIDTANGTVTSVNASGGTTGLTFSGGPITTSGTLTLAGTLAVANGGTGATTLTGVVKGNGTSAFTAGTVSLTSEVSGTLPVANGGTGVTSSTGTVAVVLSNSPVLVTPNLGTPSAVTLTNATGLPLTTGVTGTLAVANGGTGVTTSTGTTSVVLSNSPVLVTPTLGAASATSIATGLGAVGTPSYTFTGDLNTGMWSPAADTVAFSTNGAERMRVDSTGNVLIGGGTINAALGDVVISKTSGGTATLALESQGSWNATISATSSGNMIFSNAAASERMRIDSSGNVGIGLSAPTDRLEVNGSSVFRGSALFNSSGSAGTNSAAYIRAANALSSATTPDYTWWFNDQCGLFHPAANVIGFSAAGVETMRIDSSGNVGIGTSSPSTRLHAQNAFNGTSVISTFENISNVSANTAAAIDFKADQATTRLTSFRDGVGTSSSFSISPSVAGVITEAMRITSAGNVGIGTTAPLQLLQVHGSSGSDVYMRVSNTDSGTGSGLLMGLDGNEAGVIRLETNQPLSFGTSNTERMRIDSAGNVGIGTTSPGAKLDVTSTTSGFLPPRMTTAERDAITAPPNGTILYNTTTNKLQVRAAGSWVDLH